MLPLFVIAIALVALLFSYPWEVLAVGSVAYLVSLAPVAMQARRLAREEEEAKRAFRR